MLTVTATAKEKLKELLQKQITEPEVAIRITSSPAMPNKLELVLDKEKEEDQVVKSEKGIKLLLIASDLAPALKGLVIDYQETPQGTGFTISKPAPGT
ncbi:MAG TPA: iron-sulfur cluster biosynthesis family protein [bacterium]|nr:iron-sulfur cluster biosynthesis family protein [bacterium]